jgi:ATP-binding cassette subfamily F protein 3
MITLRNASLRRGNRVLLEDVSLIIYAGQKIGITGANGTGKSSLFALLRGEIHADSGDLDIPRRLTIAHVAQEIAALDRPAIDYVIDGDAELRDIEAQLELDTDNGKHIAALYARYENCGGYTVRARAAQLLSGLGFAVPDHTRPVQSFSGGWRMRLNLAKALICRSDLLLLDEPTNHLDLDTVLWLEQWLLSYPGTLLLISHDRDFLDNVVDTIAHVEHRAITLYSGNYAQFERQRAERLALQQGTYEKQQREIAHMQDFVARFRAKASKARQAQSRLKALDRMTVIAAAHVDSPFQFSFREPAKYPSPLLRLDEADAGYNDVAVLKQIKLILEPGERLGILGRNGAGKSTLIKLLAGELPVLNGKRIEGQNLRIGYFAQHQLEQLNPAQNALQHIQQADPQAAEQEIRSFLGGFGFAGDDALRLVAPFSGGEKARLVLALLAWQRPHLLLLDEPTNHLDLDMRDALTLALQEYQGAVVVVSHDRYLLRTLADRLVLVADGRVTPFDGDLEDYRVWLSQTQNQPAASGIPIPSLHSPTALEHAGTSQNTAKSTPQVAPSSVDAKAQARQLRLTQQQQRRLLEKRLVEIEKHLGRLYEEKTVLEAWLADAASYQPENTARLKEAVAKQAQVVEQLNQAEDQWLEVSEALAPA